MLRPRVTVIAPGGGMGRAGVEFARTGEAALQALLDMLAASEGASLEYLDPTQGAADDPADALRYRPSTALARRIRLRDGTCRHPGCHVPAENCDLDHVVPFNRTDPTAGGTTTEDNLAALCRKHHRFKTFNGWNYHLQPDGTLTITTPDGHVMTTRPAGPLADYRHEQHQLEAQAWARQQRRNPDPTTNTNPGSDVDVAEHAEQSAWARRETRKARRRQTERQANAAARAARAAGAANSTDHAPPGSAQPAAADDDADWVEEYRIKHRGGFKPIVITSKPYVIDMVTDKNAATRYIHNLAKYGPDTNQWAEKFLQDIHDHLTDPPPF